MKESVDADRVLWVSLDLFLVQLDLQIIKEIMDNLTDDKFSLRSLIRARAKTGNVKEACQFLSPTVAKRAKIEKAQDGETSSQRQLTPRMIGDINTTEDAIHVTAYAVSSADSQSKNFDPSAATDTTAMDTDKTTLAVITSVSSRLVPSSMHPAPFSGVPDRDLYGAHAEDRSVAPHDTSDRTRHLSTFDGTKRMGVTSELTSQSLPFLGTATSVMPNYRYSSQGNTQFNWKDRHGIIVDMQSGRVRPSTRITTYTHTTDTEINTSTGRQVQGSSRCDKYSGLPYIQGAARHEVASNESFQSYRQKETETQQKNSTAVEDRRKLPAAERMEVEPSETTANGVENLNSNSKKMTEGAYAGREAQSAVSDDSRWSSRSNEFVGGAYSTPKPQSGVSEYSRGRGWSSRSKESTGGTFFRPEAQPGVSDLNKTLHNNLTLENGASKEAAAVRSSSAKEATPHGAGTIRVEYLPGRDDAAVSQSNSSPLPNDVTGALPVDGRGYSLYKREENGLFNEVRQNTHISTGSSASRFLQDQGKADEKVQEFKSKRDDYSERSGKDHVRGADALSVKKDLQSSYAAGTTSNLSSGDKPTICSHCLRPKAELICQNCLSIMCKVCEKICETDLCERTKGKHVFMELKDGGVSKKTENLSDTTSSNRPLFSPVYEGNEWSCSRCTFLNKLEHKICVMCGTTRGVGDVEQSKPGSRVCGNCTFHNKKDATVCEACYKTLDKSETFV